MCLMDRRLDKCFQEVSIKQMTDNDMEEEIVCNRWKDLAGDQMKEIFARSVVQRFHSMSSSYFFSSNWLPADRNKQEKFDR